MILTFLYVEVVIIDFHKNNLLNHLVTHFFTRLASLLRVGSANGKTPHVWELSAFIVVMTYYASCIVVGSNKWQVECLPS
jgi:hypothetical protein